ncbi:prolow-density lipoprotein receptor-related protein 1-like [Pipra filicauda]|uniref:Prolow-density lipoprotein receptor-related protein 1-like n=1 Tax=Pipra filicauda TaxID=649802 RepID=A0A7R5KDX5_9PASS|nr:prolow-density lipoprotein receptor-related protein 1-like [Pipra filicauda]
MSSAKEYSEKVSVPGVFTLVLKRCVQNHRWGLRGNSQSLVVGEQNKAGPPCSLLLLPSGGLGRHRRQILMGEEALTGDRPPPPLRLLLALLSILLPPLVPLAGSAAGVGTRRAPAAGPTCAASRQATCAAGCIPVPWLCDGEQQCPDGTDEQCEVACGGDPHVWQCDDGRCVSSSWRCDGVADCLDGSDEQDCVCGTKKVQCPGTHHCIPHWELCDQHQDCEDGWDEEGCPQQPCLPGQWQCRNRVCIMAEWKCNGIDDCGDSSDEDVCATCPPGMVRCDEGKCILESLMCNEEADCLDGTDEPSTCDQSCFVRNGGCAETCADTHWGVQCSCGAGWVLQADGQSCADVDECSLEYSPCSQLCSNTPGTYSCACLRGYTLQHGTACEVTDNATQILVAVGQDLALLDVRTQAYRPRLSTKTESRALVYDQLRETYFWLTEDGELRVHSLGKGTQPLYADAREVNSISLDWFTGQLYWASSHPPAICAGLGDGRGYVTVLGKDIAPEQLTVHPAARSLYWVNRGQRGRTVIAAAGMDGSNRRELTVVPMEEPVGLSLDHVAGRLYWISEYKESIETLRVDGSGRHSFHAVLRSHTEPLGLAVFESRFFWTDGTELVSATLASPQEHAVLLRAPVSAFTVVHALQQPPRDTAACAPGLCSHLCLLSPVHPRGYKCACPEGLFLLPSGKCTELSIMYASGKAISLVHVGPGAHSKWVQEWQEPFHLQDVDWQRSVLYGTDDRGMLLSVVGHPGRREAIATGQPVCSARVDIRSGDLYWLACNRRDIGVIRTSDMFPRILHRARSSIQHLFLDWQRGALYWLARGQPLQQLSLAGGAPWDAWNETWPGDLPAAMDSRAFSVLWSSTLGLQALSLTKRQAVTLAPSWPHGLVAAFEPYLVSANGTALLLWDRRTLALVLSMPAASVQGVVAFVGSELQAVPPSKGSALPLPPPVTTTVRTTASTTAARPTTSTTRSTPSKTTTVLTTTPAPTSKATTSSQSTPTTTTQSTSTKTTSLPTTATPTKTTTVQPTTTSTTTTTQALPTKVIVPRPTTTTQHPTSPARVVPPTPPLPSSPAQPLTPVLHLSCPRTHVSCRDGTECVAQEYLCDGEKDCADGSDEDGCAQLCNTPGAFHCASGAMCVGAGERCDGVPQCPDASDETGCWTPTQECALRCDAATRCIPKSWLCDGHADCLDHTDEQGCVPKECGPAEFPCRNGQCVALALHCDGDHDCQDHSDEEGCAVPRPLLCRAGEVTCSHSGECVPEAWRCDGAADCGDGTDEQDCPWEEALCGDQQWGCSHGHECIPDVWRCDGETDCTDGSDEAGCQPAPCQSHEYPCGLGTCLNASLVCDGRQDCADGSDEGGNCSVPCKQSCAHLCYPSPQGPRCWCGPGYRLAEDSLFCMDIDECTEWGEGACSQTCLNAPGSYSCGCLPGYLLEPDGRVCKLTGPEPVLLVAVQSEVLSYGLRSGRKEVLLATDKDRVIFSLDYDLVERKVFWMDLATESIRWQDLNSGKKGTLVKGVRSDCIAVDWLGRNLYWTDGAAGQVLATRLGAAWQGIPEYTVVMDGDLDQPHSLVLQPLAGLLYWSEVGSHPRLMESTMDGSRWHVLLAKGLGWPTALALDLPTQRIFWLDEKLGSVSSARLDGTSVKVLKLSWVQSPFAAAVCEGQIYWSERKTWSVQQVDKASGKNRTTLLKQHGQPHGLQVMHPALRPTAPNPCETRGCSHLCLLSARHTGQCRCPPRLVLAADETTCLPLRDSAFALLVSPAAVAQVYLKDLPATSGSQELPLHRALPLAKVGHLTAIDYAVKDKSLYFAEVGGNSIGLLRLKDWRRLSWKKAVAVEGTVTSLALDWLSGNLYWIRGQPPSIHVAAPGGRWTLALLSEGLQGAAWLALCPRASTMCFITAAGSHGPGATVECAAMDGTGRRAVWRRARAPTGLTFGAAGTRLYWADHERGTISSVELDGSHFRVVREGLHGLSLFAIGEGFLLWSTTSTNGSSKIWHSRLERAERWWFAMEKDLVAMRIYSQFSQEGTNACAKSNGGCAQLCLPNPAGRQCRCSHGYHLVRGAACAPALSCPATLQPCSDLQSCISGEQVCDGRSDCADGSDESDCPSQQVGTQVPAVSPSGMSHVEEQKPASPATALQPRQPSPSPPAAPGPREHGEPFLVPPSTEEVLRAVPCSSETCNLRGDCAIEAGRVTCHCALGYRGDYCEEAEVQPLAGPIVLGVAVLLLLAAAAVGTLAYMRRRDRRRRTSSTASTRVLTLYHRESDPEEEDEEEEEELPPKSDTFVNEAYDGKEELPALPRKGPSHPNTVFS